MLTICDGKNMFQTNDVTWCYPSKDHQIHWRYYLDVMFIIGFLPLNS